MACERARALPVPCQPQRSPKTELVPWMAGPASPHQRPVGAQVNPTHRGLQRASQQRLDQAHRLPSSGHTGLNFQMMALPQMAPQLRDCGHVSKEPTLDPAAHWSPCPGRSSAPQQSLHVCVATAGPRACCPTMGGPSRGCVWRRPGCPGHLA